MKLLVITDLSFPSGSAMSSRINSFCKLFKEIGYDIHVIAGKTEDKSLKHDNIYKNDIYSYEIVSSSRSSRVQTFIGNENLVKRVDDYLSDNKVDLVFFNSLGALFNKVFKVCKKYNVKTLLEQCEWYDPSTFRFKSLDLRYIRFNNNIKNNYKKVDGVISISRLLDDYYKSIHVKSIRIPSIFDVENNEYNIDLNNSNLKLIYTGSSSKNKELLKPILEQIKEFNNINLDIYGINKEEVLENIDNQNELLTNNVIVHGKVSYEELKKAFLNSNYSIFIKPERKSSNAQFPTKLAESMSFATPVITNKTGDIDLYIKNGENGFIVDINNISKTFNDILKLNDEEYNKIRVETRKTALNNFDYRLYKDKVLEFINTL